MTFRLGINYWPISSAMYWWQRFDADEFARDAARIRVAGFDSIRIFLLWDDFQPAPDWVSKNALGNLKIVADIAKAEELSIIVTLFTGHMSGANWLPRWATQTVQSVSTVRFPIISDGRIIQGTPKNWYADEEIMKAQTFLAREVAGSLSGHRSIWAWDLGNENSNVAVPPSRTAGINWLSAIAGEIKSVDSTNKITIGLHMEDLEEDRRIGPNEAAQVCDFLCMHGYPIYADWANGPTDALLLPFLGLLTRWLGRCEVLFEEFGAPTLPDREINSISPHSNFTLLEETVAAEYAKEAIGLLNEYGFIGAMLWCYGDYAKELRQRPPFDRAPHERFFGLWRNDGTPKATVDAITAIADMRKTLDPDLSWIDVEPEEFYQRPRENLARLYRMFSSVNKPSLASFTT